MFTKKLTALLILLLLTFEVFALTDLGQTETVNVSASRTSESASESSAEVFVIDSEEINRMHPQTTAELLDLLTSVSFNSTGSLGSLQTVNIRGFGADRTQVFINGVPVSTAHQSSFDISQIPVDSIEEIEVITSGSGKKGQSVACGGIVNIKTKASDKESLSVGFENGSFLPLSDNNRALLDSQIVNVNYSTQVLGQALSTSFGGIIASNEYSYKNSEKKWKTRDNSEVKGLNSTVNLTGTIDEISYSSSNVFSIQKVGVPGSLSWVTPLSYNIPANFCSANTISYKDLSANLGYSFNYLKDGSQDTDPLTWKLTDAVTVSKLQSHKLSFNLDYDFKFSDFICFTPYLGLDYDLDKSENIKDRKAQRIKPQAGAAASFDFEKLSVYPMAKLAWVSDSKKLVPEASLGLEYFALNELSLSLVGAFSEHVPSFSDLYYENSAMWSYGNPNLKPELVYSSDLGIKYNSSVLNYRGDAFVKYIKDAIVWVNDTSTYCYKSENLSKSFYYGYDQSLTVSDGALSVNLGWLINKSFDLSDNRKLSDEVPVSYVRENTLTGSLNYEIGKFILCSDCKYMGKYESKGTVFEGTLLVNAGIDYKVLDGLNLYLKVDNLFNEMFELSVGYPMPGTKIRLGGSWTIL